MEKKKQKQPAKHKKAPANKNISLLLSIFNVLLVVKLCL
jgi:hypothetical protein